MTKRKSMSKKKTVIGAKKKKVNKIKKAVPKRKRIPKVPKTKKVAKRVKKQLPKKEVPQKEKEIRTKEPVLKRKRKKKQAVKDYFTQETEAAIIEYNNEENQDIRNQIYQEKIAFPLSKLIENVFNRWKFSYFKTSPQDVQKEALAHLVSNMGKFDPNRPSKAFGKKKKSKAFSYFSVIAKNWFILLNNNNYKEFQANVEISEERDEHTVQLQHVDKHHAQVETDEFMNLTINFWEENVGKIFTKSRDLNIANAVVELLRNSQRIDAFNKKALYLYIREISECKTQQITKVINKMKQYHKNIYRSYINEGIVPRTVHVTA